MKPEQSEGRNAVTNLTHKTIARSAGYYTYESGGRYAWRNYHGWINEVSMKQFDTEEAAYEDCCEVAGLVVGEVL